MAMSNPPIPPSTNPRAPPISPPNRLESNPMYIVASPCTAPVPRPSIEIRHKKSIHSHREAPIPIVSHLTLSFCMVLL